MRSGESARPALAAGGKLSKKKKGIRRFELVKNRGYYLLCLPAMLLFFLFAYMPMPGVLLAFKRYTITGGIFSSPWVGWENFRMFFSGPDFLRVTRNTLIINLANLIFGTGFSILFALMLNELFSQKAKKSYQIIMFLPTFLSVLLVTRFVNLILNDSRGLLNMIIERSGGNAIAFYKNSAYWVPILVILNVWKGSGYGLIIYLASMTGIDSEIYEAARIDGAGRWKQLTRITLPLLVPTIVTLTLLSIGRMFYGDFQTIYALVGRDNYELMKTLDIIETYLYRTVTSASPNYGIAGAIGLYQTLLGFLMIFGSNLLVKKINPDYALF